MTERLTGPAPGARITAPVKWYDAAKGYGFLAPGGGLPDIFCHVSVLDDVGLAALLVGATVTVETVQGDKGPQVARIHAVDFSTASAVPALSNGGMQEELVSPPVSPPSSGHTIKALVKWFMPGKGYGFLEPEDGSADVFCHVTVVQASGHDALPQGAVVTCEVEQGDRGPQVSRIHTVDVPAAWDHATGHGQPRHDFPDPAGDDHAPAGLAEEIRGTVKFYDTGKGFGFVTPDGGGREVYVHASVLSLSGLDALQPGQRVSVWAEELPRGLQATEVEPI